LVHVLNHSHHTSVASDCSNRSFPTRRSSDLPMKIQHIHGLAPLYTNTFLITTDAGHGIIVDPAAAPETYLQALEKEGARLTHILDRKSTRLNSSHVSHSYAGFCLKKKQKIIK